MTDSEKFDRLIEAVIEEFYKQDFPYRLTFDIPGTENTAILGTVPNALKKTDFNFQIGVHRQGHDKLVSYFWKSGPEEEVREYLKNALDGKEEQRKIRKALEELSDSVDKKMD